MTMFGPGRGRRGSQSDRKKGKDLKQIRPLLQFIRPYRSVVFGALVALTVSAAAVLAMGVAPELAAGSLRITTGPDNRPEDIDRLLAALREAVPQLRAGS